MRAVIFANGVLESWPTSLEINPEKDVVIAADGGTRHCRKWNIIPHIVVGDLDSVDPADLMQLQGMGVEIIKHPRRKDETDLELALKVAVDRDIREIVILGSLGARWDMTFSNVLILTAPFLSHVQVSLLDGSREITRVRGGMKIRLKGRAGDGLSVLPLTETAEGVTLHGLEYSLVNETLNLGTSRGVSNIFIGEEAEIGLKKGCLLIVVEHIKGSSTH